MPDLNDLRNNLNIDFEAMKILLSVKASKTALNIEEFIQLALSNGSSKKAIKAELLADLKEGGRIFGEFRNSIRATSNGIINRMRDSAEFSELINTPKFRWVAVLVNTCPDCLERHGEIGTMEEWEQKGLPRTGFTVCKENCKCVLLPADSTILEPIRRKKK